MRANEGGRRKEGDERMTKEGGRKKEDEGRKANGDRLITVFSISPWLGRGWRGGAVCGGTRRTSWATGSRSWPRGTSSAAAPPSSSKVSSECRYGAEGLAPLTTESNRHMCCGSSRFLKATYGVGYTFAVVKAQSSGAADATSDAPPRAPPTPPPTSSTTLVKSSIIIGGDDEDGGDDIDAVVRRHVPAAQLLSAVGAEQSYRLPFDASALFVALFSEVS